MRKEYRISSKRVMPIVLMGILSTVLIPWIAYILLEKIWFTGTLAILLVSTYVSLYRTLSRRRVVIDGDSLIDGGSATDTTYDVRQCSFACETVSSGKEPTKKLFVTDASGMHELDCTLLL